MHRLIPASLIIIVAAVATILVAASPDPAPGLPQYSGDNRLLLPRDYREWIFLSSGLGMSYSAQAGHEMFTNVFVPQWAYREFMKSGKWPSKTMFVVEDRGSTSKGSINKLGHYQTDSMGIGVEVKDESRFPTNGPTSILTKIRSPRAQIRRMGVGIVMSSMQRSSMCLCSFIRR